MPVRRRSGHLLVEALCALALGGVVTVAAATVLSGSRTALDRLRLGAESDRVAREALGVATSLLAASDSLSVLPDSAVDLSLRIGIGVACARDSLAVWMSPSRVIAGEPLTSWAQRPDVGDELAALVPDTVAGGHAWVGESIDAVSALALAAPCDAAHGWVDAGDAGAHADVLTTRTVLAAVSPGSPLRVTRRGRLTLYVDGRGEWMLGWRRCQPGACGAVQPIAGPLRTPAAGGFRVTVLDSLGTLRVAVFAVGAAAPIEALVARRDATR